MLRCSFRQAQFLSFSSVKLSSRSPSLEKLMLQLLLVLFWFGVAVLLVVSYPLPALLFAGVVVLAGWVKTDIDKKGLW